MKRNILDYFSIIHNEMASHTGEYDSLLAEFDDETPYGQTESKKIALERLDLTITELQELRNKISGIPLSKLREEFLQ